MVSEAIYESNRFQFVVLNFKGKKSVNSSMSVGYLDSFFMGCIKMIVMKYFNCPCDIVCFF